MYKIIKNLKNCKNALLFKVIRGRMFVVINRLRPANLKDYRQCAPNATGFLSDVYKRGTRAKKFLADGVQCGRSMIEMLGVLAIIGVLSVGGVAGYGKAMRMWTSNQQKEQISQLFHSFIRLRYEFSREKDSADKLTQIMPVLNALGEIPAGLTFRSNGFYDKTGNYYSGFYGLLCWQTSQGSKDETCGFQMALEVTLVKTDSSLIPSSEDLCVNIISVAKENSQDVSCITTFNGNSKDDDDPNHWRGYEQKGVFTPATLKVATPMQMLNVCKECNKHSYCKIKIGFNKS